MRSPVFLDHRRLAGKPAPRVRAVRGEKTELLVEFQVVGDDRGGGRAHGLAHVAPVEMGFEPLLGLRRHHEDEAARRTIGAGGPELGEVGNGAERLVGDRPVLPPAMGAGMVEELVESVVGKLRQG